MRATCSKSRCAGIAICSAPSLGRTARSPKRSRRWRRSPFVVAVTAFASPAMLEAAQVLLLAAAFAESSGTYVSLEGRWQSFTGAARAPGEARPGWKILRVLGNLLDLPDFDYQTSEQVRDELRAAVEQAPARRYGGGFLRRAPAGPKTCATCPCIRWTRCCGARARCS